MSNQSTYQDRVIAEKAELQQRYNALNTFMKLSPVYLDLDETEQNLLIRQAATMVEYLDILSERIMNFK